MSKPPKLNKKSKYSIAPWYGDQEGEKIILYGESGIGKTTISAMAPNPVFIGIDDGGRKILHPKTKKPLNRIEGIETFDDVLDCLSDVKFFDDIDTVVVDNITFLEQWALPYLFKTVSKNQSGDAVKNVEDYGYHKGYRRWHDVMRLPLSLCDELVRRGKNILMVAQSTIAKSVQAGTEDFVKEGPELHHDKNVSTLNAYVSWADHVFRIARYDNKVKQGKVEGTSSRAIYAQPEPWFYAKSRTLDPQYDIVAFDNPADDSIWKLLFEGKE